MRLAGEAKLGYYPTPLSVIRRCVSGFRLPPVSDPWTSFDPFCGTGAALAAFPAPYRYGIDWDQGRLVQAQSVLTATLVADAWSLTPQLHRISLLLLNPPYMTDPISGERQELRALATFLPWVHRRGWLVWIVPRRVLLDAWRTVDAQLTIQACWRFPDPEVAAYGQLIVIGQPRHRRDPQNDWAHWFRFPAPLQAPPHESATAYSSDRTIRSWQWPAVLPNTLLPQWPLPSIAPSVTLKAVEPLAMEVAPLLSTASVWQTVQSQTQPPTTLTLHDPIATPLTLHRGHLATLLTAGRLTGAIGTGETRHLVKGRTVPYTVTTVSTDDRHVEETRYRIELTTIHPDGTIRHWEPLTETTSPVDMTNAEVSSS